MKRFNIVARVLLVVLGPLCAASMAATTSPAGKYQPDASLYSVEVARYDWHDAKRDSEVRAKFYFPKTGDGPLPVIIFSHGLGGTREGCEAPCYN